MDMKKMLVRHSMLFIALYCGAGVAGFLLLLFVCQCLNKRWMQLRQNETKLRESVCELMRTSSIKHWKTGSNDADKSATLYRSEDGLDQQSTEVYPLLNPQQSIGGFVNYWNDDLESDALDVSSAESTTTSPASSTQIPTTPSSSSTEFL